MTPLGIAVRLGKLIGLHVSPLSQEPSRTLLGLPEPDLVIDVGANIGQFARDARGRFPRARIISIEPLPSAFPELAKWVAADGNAQAVNCAVGAEEAMLPMNVCLDYTVSSSLLATSATGVETYPEIERQKVIQVPVRRLDDLLREKELKPTARTLLKLDVQGYEEHALRGAPETLQRVGALLVEVNVFSHYNGQADFDSLYRFARDAGMHFVGNTSQSYGRDGRINYFDALFRR